MDAHEAIIAAKLQLANFFKDEKIKNVGLEEVDFSEEDQEWRITLGFSRPWNEPRGVIAEAQAQFGQGKIERIYKIVHIPENGTQRVRLTNRELAA